MPREGPRVIDVGVLPVESGLVLQFCHAVVGKQMAQLTSVNEVLNPFAVKELSGFCQTPATLWSDRWQM